jgi:hypothetical protein
MYHGLWASKKLKGNFDLKNDHPNASQTYHTQKMNESSNKDTCKSNQRAKRQAKYNYLGLHSTHQILLKIQSSFYRRVIYETYIC